MKDAVNNEPVEDNIEVDVIGNQGAEGETTKQTTDNKEDSGTGTVARPYDDHMNASNVEAESSNFMAYFFALTIFTMCGYLIFYNKKKLIALILEGRGRSTGRRSRSGSR